MAMMTARAMVAGAAEVVVTAVAVETAMVKGMERAVALVAVVTAMAKVKAKTNSPNPV